MNIDVYEKNQKRKWYLIFGITIFSLLSALIFMTIFTNVSVFSIPDVIYRFMTGGQLTAQEKIIIHMRMPAVLMALVAGIALSISGAVMQSVTHNDLVSPFTLGVSSAAAFGASVCIISGSSILHSTVGMILGAFISSCICIFLVYSLSAKIGISASALVLVGISMNYFFSALSATIQFFAQEYKLGEIIQWTFGTFSKADWKIVGMSSVVLLIAIIIYAFLSLQLDAMANNDDEMVKSLGIQPERTRMITGMVAVLLTSTIISFTGVIGFIGLIAPHIARTVIGNEHRTFLPMAAVTGACLLLYSDAIGKYILYPVMIPVGIVISFVGVPLFVHLVISMRGRGE